jgi:hypothetical protein
MNRLSDIRKAFSVKKVTLFWSRSSEFTTTHTQIQRCTKGQSVFVLFFQNDLSNSWRCKFLQRWRLNSRSSDCLQHQQEKAVNFGHKKVAKPTSDLGEKLSRTFFVRRHKNFQ